MLISSAESLVAAGPNVKENFDIHLEKLQSKRVFRSVIVF